MAVFKKHLIEQVFSTIQKLIYRSQAANSFGRHCQSSWAESSVIKTGNIAAVYSGHWAQMKQTRPAELLNSTSKLIERAKRNFTFTVINVVMNVKIFFLLCVF